MAPRWLDTRLVLGVLLVLVSVLIGARVLAGADKSQLVWATNRALAPGSVLAQVDLVPVRVRLFDAASLYLDASEPAPAGYIVSRGLGAGELLAFFTALIAFTLLFAWFLAMRVRIGRLSDPDASATAHSKLCGSTVKIDLKMDGPVVTDFAHDVKACALGQASSSIMARHVVGSTAAELR